MFLAQRRFEEYISVATHFISLLNLSALLPWHFVNKTRTATTEPGAWYCYKLLRSHGTDLTSANAIKSCLSPLVQVVKIGEVGGVGGVGVGHWTLDIGHDTLEIDEESGGNKGSNGSCPSTPCYSVLL